MIKAIRVRCVLQGCQQPLTHDKEGLIDDIIMHAIWPHLCKKKNTCEKDVVGNGTFVLDWFTSNQSHYYLYYNGIPRFLRKLLMLKVK